MLQFMLIIGLLRMYLSELNQFGCTEISPEYQFIGDPIKYQVTNSKLECITYCLGREKMFLKASLCDNICYCYQNSAEVMYNTQCQLFQFKSEMKNCYDIYRCYSQRTGIYNISVKGTQLQVYCDMTRGGWTTVQSRLDGSVNFLRNYSEYQIGFGNVTGEHWLGLDNIHDIVASGSYEVRFDLEDFEGNTRYAEYNRFNVSDSSMNYTLEISGYSGNAGDGMKYHSGMQFTTVDVDNDEEKYGNCAAAYKGAWWYQSCHYVNINGVYNDTQYSQGISWYQWHGYYYSLKSTSMKIRPSL